MSENDTHAPNGVDNELLRWSAEIVAAYVGNNTISATDLPSLITSVHDALSGTVVAGTSDNKNSDLKPAVPVRRSVTDDFIYCLEDGQKFKSLKRHLRTRYNMTPEEYREKWSLPRDYPMVAPNYAQARSKLAREMGLGQKRER